MYNGEPEDHGIGEIVKKIGIHDTIQNGRPSQYKKQDLRDVFEQACSISLIPFILY